MVIVVVIVVSVVVVVVVAVVGFAVVEVDSTVPPRRLVPRRMVGRCSVRGCVEDFRLASQGHGAGVSSSRARSGQRNETLASDVDTATTTK